MTNTGFRRLVGGLAVAVPATMALFSVLLVRYFDYPQVMDRPAAEVLTHLGRAGAAIPAYWFGVAASAVGLVALAVAVDRVLRDEARGDPGLVARLPYLSIVTTAGVAAGTAIAVDVGQWTSLYPHLARRFVAPTATPADRANLEIVWEAFHHYVGEGVGIYAATFASAVWVLGLTWILVSGRRRSHWSTWLAGAAGVLFLTSILPGMSFDGYSRLNSAGFALWAAWLVIVGVRLLRGRPMVAVPSDESAPVVRPGVASQSA